MQDQSQKLFIENLQQSSQIKVWSLLVSAFGDLTPETKTSLSGSFLNQLFARMGIKPEALRVALHRLRKDGWIISEKTGRTSEYRLTEYGLAETENVRGRIYSSEYKRDKNLVLAVFGEFPVPEKLIALNLGGGTHLMRGSPELSNQDVLLSDVDEAEIPQWVYTATAPDNLKTDCQELLSFISTVGSDPDGWDGLGKFTYRLLVLHFWRRIILRDIAWYHVQILTDGPVVRCHHEVIKILDAISADTGDQYVT